MAEYPALPLFTDAYMADTRHLTTTQHGAYLLLLMTAWRMPDCKLPDDDKLLARWAGLDYRNWCKIRPEIIDQFWKKDADGKLQQCRLLDERKYADSIRQKNAAAGRASALKRKDRHSTTVPTKTQPDSNPHTHTLPIIKDNTIVLSKNPTQKLKKATRLLETWELEQEEGDWAEAQGLKYEEVKLQEAKFKDYWIGSGKTKVDWKATWRNWIRTTIEGKYKNGLR